MYVHTTKHIYRTTHSGLKTMFGHRIKTGQFTPNLNT